MKSMLSLLSVALLLLEGAFVIAGVFGATTTYNVGGDKGWVVGIVNYTEWAANYTFYAGDSIVFKYVAQVHTVLETSKSSYENCSTSNPKASYEDGNTTIILRQVGAYYFVCGVAHHCPAGQKLQVVALEAPAPPPFDVPPPFTAGGLLPPTNLAPCLSAMSFLFIILIASLTFYPFI